MAGGRYYPSTQLRTVDPQLLRDLRIAFDLVYELRAELETLRAAQQSAQQRNSQTPEAPAVGRSHLTGFGTPEGRVIAPPGSTYSDLHGGTGTTFYVKETGQGSTGWIAK